MYTLVRFHCSDCNLVGEGGSTDLTDSSGNPVVFYNAMCAECGGQYVTVCSPGKAETLCYRPQFGEVKGEKADEVIKHPKQDVVDVTECVFCRNKDSVWADLEAKIKTCPNCSGRNITID